MQGLGNLFGSKHGYKVPPNQVNIHIRCKLVNLWLLRNYFGVGTSGAARKQLDGLLHVLSSHVRLPVQKSCSGAALKLLLVSFLNLLPTFRKAVVAVVC